MAPRCGELRPSSSSGHGLRLRDVQGELLDEGSELGSDSDSISSASSSYSSDTEEITGDRADASGSDGSSEDEAERTEAAADSSGSGSTAPVLPRRSLKRRTPSTSETATPPAEGVYSRWTGSATTWRRYTQNERLVWEGLMRERAQDLSVHLVNVYAARQRSIRTIASDAGGEASEEGSEVTGVDAHEEEEDGVYKSRKRKRAPYERNDASWIRRSWTSWPLPLESFPSDAEPGRNIREDSGTNARVDLEDILLGIVLRETRRRLERRSWVVDVPPPADDDIKPGEGAETEPDPDPPKPMTDDDYARALLLPSIRSLLSSFDGLLDNLHIQQMGAARSSRRTTGVQRSRKRTKTESEAADSAESSSGSSSVDKTYNSSLAPRMDGRRKRPALRPRTWISVLSLAALKPTLALPRSPVQEAKERCEILFEHTLAPSHLLNTLLSTPSNLESTRIHFPTISRPSPSHQEQLLLGRNASSKGRHRNPHISTSELVVDRLKGTIWTEEEDQILAGGIEAGRRFGEIVTESEVLRMNGRTRNACKGRWRTIGVIRERALERERAGLVRSEAGGEEERWGGVRRDGFLMPILVD